MVFCEATALMREREGDKIGKITQILVLKKINNFTQDNLLKNCPL